MLVANDRKKPPANGAFPISQNHTTGVFLCMLPWFPAVLSDSFFLEILLGIFCLEMNWQGFHPSALLDLSFSVSERDLLLHLKRARTDEGNFSDQHDRQSDKADLYLLFHPGSKDSGIWVMGILISPVVTAFLSYRKLTGYLAKLLINDEHGLFPASGS